jgi:hypothetical protein
MTPRNYLKRPDNFVKRMQNSNYSGNGLYLTIVSDKGNPPDGQSVVGQVKTKIDQEAKDIAS